MPGSVIDSFFISLGFAVDPAGLRGVNKQVDQAKHSLLSLGTALTGFVTGFAIKGIAKLGSEFESSRIAIAGMLSALGASPNFTAGLDDADKTLQSIIKTSAALPGTAEEYIEVFKAGLPSLTKVIPTIQGITEFTNTLAAVAKTANANLPADQIARESRELLGDKSRATARNVLFQTLLPLMQKVQGQAHLTAESFNALSQEKRVDLLRQSFVGMKPAIDAAAHSFDAMWGAIVADTQLILRTGTKPLFDGIKKGLDQLASLFFKADGSVTEFGQSFVDGAAAITTAITAIMSMAGSVTLWLVKSEVGAKVLKVALLALGLALAGLALGKIVGSFSALFGVLTNIKLLMSGALLAAIVLIAEDLYVFAQGGDSLTGRLLERFPMIKTVLADVGVIIRTIAGGISDLNSFLKSLPYGNIQDLGEAFAGSKDAIVVACVAIGIALAAAFFPITTALAAALALQVALVELAGHAKEPEALKNFNEPQGFQRYGSKEADDSPAFLKRNLKPHTWHTGWHVGAPPPSAGGSVSTDRSTTVNNRVDKLVVVSPNANDAGKAVQRSLARNSQTGVSH